MKILTILENFGAFVLKNWQWSLLIVCIFMFLIFPHKPFGPMLAGMSAIGFIWSAFAIYKKLSK